MISMRFVCFWNVHDDFFSWFVVVVAFTRIFHFSNRGCASTSQCDVVETFGPKYSLTAEVTRLRLRGEGLAVWVGVSDLRQSRRHERMNGSKPSCPSGDPQTSVEVPTPFLRRALPFPSPRPSPSGRGRILRWLSAQASAVSARESSRRTEPALPVPSPRGRGSG